MKMNNLFAGIIVLISFSFFWGCKPNKTFTEREISVVPQVQKMTLGESCFQFNKNTRIVVENAEQVTIARQLSDKFVNAAGFELQIDSTDSEDANNQVNFVTDQTLQPEGYLLEVAENRIDIKAAAPAGFFYAIQTLCQLLPVELESSQIQSKIEWLVPVIKISDSPVFQWRGLMLDVSRHFFPKEDILKMIDNLALHKMNTLHFHLVDDQGWRIEIKKYPKLTEVGAWRVDQEDKPWNDRPNDFVTKATYGGFYTQEDIKEIVAYAKSRFITVIPEIEMPAHITCALAAYPEYSCSGGPFVVPSGGVWPITDIYCVGNDSVFHFLEDVLSEVIDLFPSKYIHIGGDEATKTEWEQCPKCKKRMKTEGLKNTTELQSYFINRIEKFIRSKNRVLIGWEDVMEGGLSPNAAVMSWKGTKAGIEAAHMGHHVVMTPETPCMFNKYQGPIDHEPLSYLGFNPLTDVYNFNPTPTELNGVYSENILGGQATLWAEYIPNIKQSEHMAFPRVAALSEVLWSSAEVRSWQGFSRRLQILMNRYDLLGINYSKSSFLVTAKTQIEREKKKLSVALNCELAGSKINYTTDGSSPNEHSKVYSVPIELNGTTTIKAISYFNNIASEKSMNVTFKVNKATACKVTYLSELSKHYSGSGDYNLVDGVRGGIDFNGKDWQGWVANNMEVVIDLGQATGIHKFSVGSLQNSSYGFFFPTKIQFYVSSDGNSYSQVSEILNDVDPSREMQLKDFTAKFNPVVARFVKIVAFNIGKCPKGHNTEGEAAWLFTDEIEVE